MADEQVILFWKPVAKAIKQHLLTWHCSTHVELQAFTLPWVAATLSLLHNTALAHHDRPIAARRLVINHN
eukprot:2374-Heterococcus_DN1.PRE.6